MYLKDSTGVKTVTQFDTTAKFNQRHLLNSTSLAKFPAWAAKKKALPGYLGQPGQRTAIQRHLYRQATPALGKAKFSTVISKNKNQLINQLKAQYSGGGKTVKMPAPAAKGAYKFKLPHKTNTKSTTTALHKTKYSGNNYADWANIGQTITGPVTAMGQLNLTNAKKQHYTLELGHYG